MRYRFSLLPMEAIRLWCEPATLHPLLLPNIAEGLGPFRIRQLRLERCTSAPVVFSNDFGRPSFGVPDEQAENAKNLKERAQEPPSREGSIGH
jgi:hypothetical protein